MYKSPQRISISPVSRQKSDDDYYLVDRDVYPGKGTEYVRVDLFDTLTAENERLKAALTECAEAFELHASAYPAMVKGYTLDAQTNARQALAAAKGE